MESIESALVKGPITRIQRSCLMFNLEGHVALVTGGNGGIGLAYARGLVKSGAAVALWGRNIGKNQTAVDELRSLGGNVHAFVCDVTDEAMVKQVFADTVAHFGKVDSCFANAGGGGEPGRLHETDSENWSRVMDMNVTSVVHTFRPVIAHLIERKASGKLLVTSSIAALMGMGFQASYSTTKAAVVGLIRALAVELGANGITANAILPGYIESDLTAAAPKAFKEGSKRRVAGGRLGTSEDMEGIAVFLASRHSNYMTGQTIAIDGGHSVFPL
jgi:NAD(P)-dependent dehydrogenase (short-subunit alcohol dehydrogenase family)